MTERYSVHVLRECIDLQNKKANDYQNPNSTIKQADYYPSGCLTILEIIHAKVLRMRSVMEAMQNDPNYKPNFESLEDLAKNRTATSSIARSSSQSCRSCFATSRTSGTTSTFLLPILPRLRRSTRSMSPHMLTWSRPLATRSPRRPPASSARSALPVES